MTDREMLLLAYGAMKVVPNTNLATVVSLIEDHLYPPQQEPPYPMTQDVTNSSHPVITKDWACSCGYVNGKGQFKCGKCGKDYLTFLSEIRP